MNKATGNPLRREYRAMLGLFLLLLLSYAYFLPRWASWSQNSRLDLVIAIVDDHSLSIDPYYSNTGDYAFYEGHYYSDKAPGHAFLGVPAYAVFRAIASLPPAQRVLDRLARSGAFEATLREDGTGLQTEKVRFAAALYFVSFVTVSIPSALLGVLLYRALGTWDVPDRPRFWVTLVYGLATPAFAYSGVLFSHQLVAFLLFAPFYMLSRSRGRSLGGITLFLIGLMLGWAVITEYPAALIAGAIALYAVWVHRSWRTVVWGALGGLAPGVLLMAYDYAIFGSILPKGYLYSVNYQEIHGVGLVSLTYPHPTALWGITFGSMRGLFFLSPILLLAIAGLAMWWRRGEHRAECAVSVWAVLSFLLYNGSSIMWQGGYAVGPRYLLPAVPFLSVGLGTGWQALVARRPGQLLIGLLTAWSLGAVWVETIGGQSFPDWTPNPLFHYSLPKFLAGDIARNLGMAAGLDAHWSVMPLLALIVGLAWLSFPFDSGLQEPQL